MDVHNARAVRRSQQPQLRHGSATAQPQPVTALQPQLSPAFAQTREIFTRVYRERSWQSSALSGIGSRPERTQGFRDWLATFLQQRGIHSVLEGGCGHWPTGWQRATWWHNAHYHGIDVVDFVVNESRTFLTPHECSRIGLASATF